MSHNHSLAWMADRARHLRSHGAVRGKSWSLAQVCEHLALAVQGTVDHPPPDSAPVLPPQWWTALHPLTRLSRHVAKHALLRSGTFPKGVPSPRVVIPSDSADLDAMIQRLQSAAAAFDRKRSQASARWVFHPLLGPMTGAQWNRFHDLHAHHHFKFMSSP